MNTPSPINNRRMMAILATLLAANIAVSLLQLVGPATASASAQPSNTPPTFPNNASLLVKQCEILTEISAKMGRIETKMDKGFNVKVTEMPEIKFPASMTDAQNNR